MVHMKGWFLQKGGIYFVIRQRMPNVMKINRKAPASNIIGYS